MNVELTMALFYKCLNLMLHSDDTCGLGLVSFQAFFPPIKQEKSEWSNIYLTFDEEVLRPFYDKT